VILPAVAVVRISEERVRMVYRWCLSRTNIDIDELACAAVMRRYGVKTKRDAVNLALRLCAVEPLATEAALALEGTGWVGDLDEMRSTRQA
jgi:Arc/MetJ family transcription regulator